VSAQKKTLPDELYLSENQSLKMGRWFFKCFSY